MVVLCCITVTIAINSKTNVIATNGFHGPDVCSGKS